MQIKVNPLKDGLIVQRDEQEKASAGGILLPETAKETPLWGVVKKVGPGKNTSEGSLIPMSIKEGDRVLFGQYSGTKISLDQQEYLFMKEDDVLAVEEA